MSRSSHLSTSRRQPSQERGEKRVASLLRSAESLFSEVGYEATTMSAIAARAGASIGSLYQFYPNKESVAQALRQRYVVDYHERWQACKDEMNCASLEDFARLITGLTMDHLAAHPATRVLMDAPLEHQRSNSILEVIAETLRGRWPSLNRPKARRLALVVGAITFGLSDVTVHSTARERVLIVKEFESLLFNYLRNSSL